MDDALPLSVTHEVRDACLCLHLQRAARAVARRFDEAFRAHGITNGQFSILMALNQPQPPRIGAVAELLSMDRTTLTAALKPLQRAGRVEVLTDPLDGRSRRLLLTDAGRSVLVDTLLLWRQTHADLAEEHPALDLGELNAALGDLSAGPSVPAS